ncbi:MAG: hypothetical protein M3R43_09695 [Acidobacteriota bacterium]|nr:hypothetical protein [Acidobacteriota bacterium]
MATTRLAIVAHGRTLGGVPVGSGQGFKWSAGSGASLLFANGDNNTKYHVTLDFTQPLLDKLGVVVPMSDCRKMYMVFAPRFESVEQDLQDGCFLTADVGTSDTTWTVDDTSKLSGGRYFIGTPTLEERIQLLSVISATQINVARGFEASTPGAWSAGTRLMKLSPLSGFNGDVEWGCAISNITVTGDGSLKVGGGSDRIEEADPRCKYTGFWEEYKYAGGFPSQWWSSGHAKRCAPSSVLDVCKVVLRYSYSRTHDLYLGSFVNTDCGKVSVSVDGVATTHDLYLNEYGGATANLKVRGSVAAGNHTVEITALFDKNAASTGYYFYFDYLWPLEPQDVPDAPQIYTDVSLAMDFDTDHGYKKPPAWHLWQLQKLGFKGHADVYIGVFWNNKRRRINATYPYATVVFSGTPVAGDVVSFSIGGTTVNHAIGYGETLQRIVSDMRAIINGLFSGGWGGRRLRIEHDIAHPIESPFVDVHRGRGERAELGYANTHQQPGCGGCRGRLGNDRRRLASHDRGRAEVDSRPGHRVPGCGDQGVVRVLDGVLPPSGCDARQVSLLLGRRRVARPGRGPWCPLAPDALRHARPDLRAPDVQGVCRPARGRGPAGGAPVR